MFGFRFRQKRFDGGFEMGAGNARVADDPLGVYDVARGQECHGPAFLNGIVVAAAPPVAPRNPTCGDHFQGGPAVLVDVDP